MKALRNIIFVVNSGKRGALDYTEKLRASVANSLEDSLLVSGTELEEQSFAGRDACCVIGGDGTILGVVGPAVKYAVPVIGINYGKLGFLTTYTQKEADAFLKDLISGHYEETPRTLLSCRTACGQSALALNDIVIKSAANAGLVTLRVSDGGVHVNTYNSDGLIFSTPTGSTAYNLAAGGPIIHPGAHVLAMTPISPHTLSNRSMILPAEAMLRVEPGEDTRQPHVLLDGRLPFEHLEKPFPIGISVPENRFTLLHRKDYDHFAIVRNKLKW